MCNLEERTKTIVGSQGNKVHPRNHGNDKDRGKVKKTVNMEWSGTGRGTKKGLSTKPFR